MRSRDFGGSPERPCPARGDCCPPGKGCNRAGPSSRDEAGVLQPLLHRTQERRWSSTNPGTVSLAQAPIQDADTQAHNKMHPAPGSVCSNRSEGRFQFFRDTYRSYGLHSVQGPPLRALPVSLCFYEGRRGPGSSTTSTIHPGPIPRSVVRSQGLGASAPQPVGASGQLGKEQALPCAENLFSRFGVRLGEYDECAQAVLNCLSFFRGRNVVPLKLLGPMASTAAVTPLGLLQ